MTAAVVPPPTNIDLTHVVAVAGDDWPQPVEHGGWVLRAILLSAGLHLSIWGLALRAVPQAVGNASQEPVTIEVVLEPLVDDAAPGGAGGSAAVASSRDTTGAIPPHSDTTSAIDEPLAADTAAEQPAEETNIAAAPPGSRPAPQARPRPAPVPHSRRLERADERVSSRSEREADPPASGERRATSDAASSAEIGPGTDVPESDTSLAPGGGGREAALTGAGPAVASERTRLLDTYGRVVWAHVAARKPKGLRLPGRAEVSFTVAADGKLLAARISRPSGNAELDRLALLTVQAAAPLPPPPSTLGEQPLTFSIPFAFH